MPFSFPSSPSIGDKSTQNSREYEWSGYAWEIVATPAALSASVITSGTFDAARLPLATTGAAGAVIVGTGLGVSSGTVSVTYGTTSGTACQGNDSRLSDARMPTSHSHGNITNAGAIGSTANLPIITTTSGVLTTGSFGTTAATFCEGNDSRLSDTRTPTDGGVTTAKIANDAVTYAKIQNVSATDRLLGRSSAGAGDVEEITCTAFGRSLIDDADAAAARSTLSVQPTASPAFTGAATFDNTGNVVPLTVTNTGTANSFVVNDAAGDTSPFVITSAGDVTIGTGRTVTGGSGGAFLASNGLNNDLVTTGRAAAITGTWGTLRVHQVKDYAGLRIIGDTSQTASYMDVENSSGTTLVSINSSGQLLVTAGSASACGVAFSGDVNTGLAQIGGADTASLVTAGVERVRCTSGGTIEVRANAGSISHGLTYNENGGEIVLYDETQTAATLIDQISTDTRVLELVNGSNLKLGLGSGNTTGLIQFMRAGYQEAMRVDASGNVLVGATPSPAFSGVTPNLQAVTTSFTGSDVDGGTIAAFGSSSFSVDRGAGVVFGFKYNTAGNYVTAARVRGAKENATDGNYAGYLAFDTRANAGNLTERMRIDSSGNVGIGAAPSFRLDVLGSANCVAKIKTSAAGSFGCLQIHNSNTNGETSIGFRDDSDSDASSWVIGKSVGGVADAFGFYYNGNRAIIESDGVVKLPDVYEDTVGATNRDLFIDNAGKLGYVSSIRASKTNIAAIDDVSWLRDLTPVSFHYRKRNEDGTYSDEADGTLDYGLIAEEVEPVAPEMCFYDVVDGEPQLRGVHYSKLITPMLRYIQQLEQRIAALEERNNA